MNDMPSFQDTIKEIEELEKKATKGPWGVEVNAAYCRIYDVNDESIISLADKHSKYSDYDSVCLSDEDFKLIVLLRNSWPAIREEMKRLREENEKLQKEINTLIWETVKKWAYKKHGLKDKGED